MATAGRYSIYPCSFVHSGGTLNLAQMDSFDINMNQTVDEFVPGGALDRSANLIATANESATFNTRDLSTYFGTVSATTGLEVVSTGATFRFQQRANAGGFSTSTSHTTVTATEGFLRPTTLTADQNSAQGATLSSEFHPTWDETNEPFAGNTSVDFTAVTSPTYTSSYFLGPVYHNSAEFTGITSVSVDFGINYTNPTWSGNPYPTLGAITTRMPTLTFTGLEATIQATLALVGRAVTSSFAIYLWKATNSGTRVAVGSSVHTKISCTAGMIQHDSMSVSGNDDGTFSLSVRPTGTISVSTTSTIP